MGRIMVEISEEQRVQIEMLVLDNDTEGAMLLLKELLTRIKRNENGAMKNHLNK